MPFLLSNTYFVEEIFTFTPEPDGSVYTKVMFSSLNDGYVGVAFGFYIIPSIANVWTQENKNWLYLLLCLYSIFNGLIPDLREISVAAIMSNCRTNAQTVGRQATLNAIAPHVIGSR